MDALFENAGSKIKTLAKIVFVICVIASLICAIVFGRTFETKNIGTSRYPTYRDFSHFNLWLFLCILFGGILASYVSSLFMYAVGEIVCHLETIAVSKAAIETQPMPTASKGNTNSVPLTRVAAQASQAPIMRRVEEEGWVCKKCGAFNKAAARKCSECDRARP